MLHLNTNNLENAIEQAIKLATENNHKVKFKWQEGGKEVYIYVNKHSTLNNILGQYNDLIISDKILEIGCIPYVQEIGFMVKQTQ